LESISRGSIDRHLEHARIYALIRIHDRDATLAGLEHANPRVRQAALTALDQMPAGELTRELVVPLLDTDDPDLQQKVLEVMSRRPDWSSEITGLLEHWLASQHRSAEQDRSLTGVLLGFSAEQSTQKLLADVLDRPDTPVATRLLLLRLLARTRLDPLPDRWLTALGSALAHDDLAVRREALSTVRARNLTRFDGQLAEISRRSDLPADVRVAALDAIAARLRQLDADSFALLTAHLSGDRAACARGRGANARGRSARQRPARARGRLHRGRRSDHRAAAGARVLQEPRRGSGSRAGTGAGPLAGRRVDRGRRPQ
jgi:hypothetical protein